jgi:hypothetical protein
MEPVKSTESGHSALSKDYNQTLWAEQKRQTGANINPPATNSSRMKPTPQILKRNPTEDGSYPASYSARAFFDPNTSIPSPVHTDFEAQRPMLCEASPFPPRSTNDDFVGPPHALNLPAQFMRAQHFPNISWPSREGSLVQSTGLGEPNRLMAICCVVSIERNAMEVGQNFWLIQDPRTIALSVYRAEECWCEEMHKVEAILLSGRKLLGRNADSIEGI